VGPISCRPRVWSLCLVGPGYGPVSYRPRIGAVVLWAKVVSLGPPGLGCGPVSHMPGIFIPCPVGLGYWVCVLLARGMESYFACPG
jgi:hypothetical protein